MAGAAFASFGGVMINMPDGSGQWHFTFDSDGSYGLDFSYNIEAFSSPLTIAVVDAFGWYDFNNPIELHYGYFIGPTSGYLGEFHAGDAISIWIKTNGSLSNIPGIYTFSSTDLGYWEGSIAGGNDYGIWYSSVHSPFYFTFAEMAPPSGKPLPGVIAALVIGGCAFLGVKLKNRMKG